MNYFRRHFKITLLLILSFCILNLSTISFAKSYILDWNLVDSGKHLDYDGDSKYMSNIKSGVGKWEAYKNGVIRPDSILVIEDVYVSDVYNVNNVNGTTSSSGTIKLNTYNLDNQSSTQVTRVCTHELGHALGLAHSTSSDIMYANTIKTSSLTQNDKDSYDEAYKNY